MKQYTTVSDFLNDLDGDTAAQAEALRTVILNAEPKLAEHIKWNAPSYVWNGEDRITFNLHDKENAVKLILHMGATRKEDKKGAPVLKDDSGLITWSSDIRGILSFNSLEDIASKRDTVATLLKSWLALG